jgi:hypothetical protein
LLTGFLAGNWRWRDEKNDESKAGFADLRFVAISQTFALFCGKEPGPDFVPPHPRITASEHSGLIEFPVFGLLSMQPGGYEPARKPAYFGTAGLKV